MKNNFIKQKKGIELSQAFGAVLSIVLVGVLVVVAIYMMVTLGTSMLPTTSTSTTYINESYSPTTVGSNLYASTLINGACGTITAVYNGTGASTLLVGSSNYTQTGCLLANTTSFNSGTWKVNYPYTYTAPSSAYNASESIVTNFSGYPVLVGLVGTIVFLGLVIGVLVASFVFGSKRGA